MSSYYYSDSNNYPSIFGPIIERVRYFFCKELLYSGETYADSQSRFIQGEITDNGFRLATKETGSTNITLPFTIYALGELETDEERVNANAVHRVSYSSTYSGIIDAAASIFNIPMMTVYNQPNDYLRGWQLLQDANLSKTKLQVPATMNGVSVSFPVLMDIEPVKGLYTFELEEQLRVGKLNTIQHDVSVYFHNFIMETDSIYPVDDIEFSINSYSESDYRDSVSVGSGVVPDTPTISSTVPSNGTSGVAVSSNIVINFNVSMNETLVEDDSIYVSPFFLYETTWNTQGTQLTINPNENLSSGISYTVTIYDSATHADGIPMEEDYSFTFGTEVN